MSALIIPNVSYTPLAITALGIFIISYAFVILEEFTQLRKSKPMLLAAGAIWLLVAWIAQTKNLSEMATLAVRHTFLDYTELLLFIIVAITYINVLENRKIFEALRAQLIKKQLSYKQLFWLTGILSFFLSGIADNLTTALVMCAVIVALGKGNKKFISLSCINLVVAVNAGGAFSPFGDITTLMVWQKGMVPFFSFFKLFMPAVVSYLIPALCMHFALPKGRPPEIKETIHMDLGAKRVVFLFLLTIATAIIAHHYFHLPPVIGMMIGLGYLQLFGFYIKKRELKLNGATPAFDVFKYMQEIHWDTPLFFYGVMMSIGGLATLGYLNLLSSSLYQDWGPTIANVVVGILSALVDNIPVMFAVLTMDPAMPESQWLLVTLTAGIGGSLLSVGSAAGVALMGQAGGAYTFFSHLKWIWAIGLGYAGGILVHLYYTPSLW